MQFPLEKTLTENSFIISSLFLFPEVIGGIMMNSFWTQWKTRLEEDKEMNDTSLRLRKIEHLPKKTAIKDFWFPKSGSYGTKGRKFETIMMRVHKGADSNSLG